VDKERAADAREAEAKIAAIEEKANELVNAARREAEQNAGAASILDEMVKRGKAQFHDDGTFVLNEN